MLLCTFCYIVHWPWAGTLLIEFVGELIDAPTLAKRHRGAAEYVPLALVPYVGHCALYSSLPCSYVRMLYVV